MLMSTVLRKARDLPRSIAILGLAGSLALATTAASAQTTVNAVMHSALRILDPVASSATIVRNHGYMVFDTLLGVNEALEPQPQMADWAISDDGLTYTFTLRDGLTWHDGESVTAADCVASLRRWAQYDAGGQLLMARINRLEVLDEESFVLEFASPFNGVIDLLAKPSAVPAFMMPERLASIPDGEMIPEQIGSGPFRFVAEEFQPGNRVVSNPRPPA
ncbi:ABC transporter substrate-binding protein [Halomonas sp. TA22]|uniref:ABC transporter substrate-binding protein n=1 Tax=Halomonas sp. TA22 TaxID=2730914 RepID=UPI001C269735|nr:ABC transporter substrate-binding protein [Halomonas sp. TA22]